MPNEDFQKLADLIRGAQNVLLIGHRKPDGDALGSMGAMKIFLDGMGKSVTLACSTGVPPRYNFLPFTSEVQTEIDLSKHDLVIVLDCGAHYMTEFDLSSGGQPVIVNIDHHSSNDMFGQLNIVDSSSASATVILYKFFEYIGATITPEMATCLLAGIYNDTGSFMHSNTSEDVYTISANLLASGAQISLIIKSLFKNNSVATLKTWGKALMNSRVTEDNFVLSVVREEDMDLGTDMEQLGGVIDYLNMVPNVQFAMLLKEENGKVKGSLRTKRDDVDLSKLASLYGGGGHPKASGFSIPGKIKEEKHYVIESEVLQNQPLHL